MLAQLQDFYRLYAPDKLGTLGQVVEKYRADPGALKAFLEAKYKVPGFFASAWINLRSSFLDPLACLYEEGVVVPVPSAQPVDNMVKCKALLPGYQPRSAVGGDGGDAGLGLDAEAEGDKEEAAARKADTLRRRQAAQARHRAKQKQAKERAKSVAAREAKAAQRQALRAMRAMARAGGLVPAPVVAVVPPQQQGPSH